MKKLKEFVKRIYRLSISYKKQEELVWEDLKNLHVKEKWQSGVYENEKMIETRFTIAKEKAATFYYTMYESQFLCRVEVLDNFPLDLTTDIFILATHFNNIMNRGKVVVNIQSQAVQYHIKRHILFHLLYPREMYFQILDHHTYATDLNWAFQQLVNTNEPPAIIIADFLKKKEEEKEERK